MIYLKRFLLKDFVLFYLLVLLFGCSSLSQDSKKTSGEPISIQENFNIEGKFKLSNLDSKETGYFVINKKLNTISLTLGKNYLLPERNYIFDIREKINIKSFIEEGVTVPSLPDIKVLDLLELFLGFKSNELGKENITTIMEYEDTSVFPSKVLMSNEDFELTLLIKRLWKN
jgi:hypothetical protein|tara:strand:+ start:1395 stop:1910 length:516 start_codon:yes stop_codon:yes gene_type:complete